VAAHLDIAIVCHNFPPHVGGVEFVAYEQGRRLAERGHSVTVYTSEVESAPAGEAELDLPPNLVVHRLPSWFRVTSMPFLRHLSQVANHQIVHLHLPFLFGAEIVGPLTRRRRVPLVVTFHSGNVGAPFDWIRAPGPTTMGNFYIRHLALRCVGNAAAVCLLSDAQDRHPTTPLRALLRKHPERRVVVPNGVDVERFRVPSADEARRAREALVAEHGLPEDIPLAVWCGRLDAASLRYKRLDVALRALKLARTPFSLVVVGGGSLRERWIKTAREMGLADRVRFAGVQPREGMIRSYWAADLLVMSSVGPEAFPLTLLEAMSTATPAIAPGLLDIKAVIEGEEQGFLFTPGDPAALAAAIDRFLALSEAEQRAIGAAGHDRVAGSFTWEISTDRIEAVLRAVVDGAPQD
jgi:glycosyltransferase involved in cell wall biosynthesis